MQDHRICGDEFFTLETVDYEIRGLCEIKARELRTDRVEALHCAHVVVLVVAHQDFFRDSFDGLRIEREWLSFVCHWLESCLCICRLFDQRRCGGDACKK